MLAPLRVGIIGTGFGARVVAPAFATVDHCTVVDVVSARDDTAVRALCQRDDIDLIGVHSPPFLHGTHVQYALDGGHAVLCDKPFGRNADEAAKMLADARSAGVVHLVDFEFRYDPMRILLRELVRKGAAGTVEHIGWTHLSGGSRVPMREHGWLFDRASGGGWIGAWGSHAIDTIRWLLDDDLTVVASMPRTDVPERLDATGQHRSVDAEDGFGALLRSARGVSVTIDSSFAAVTPVAPRLVVTTNESVIELTADARITVRNADGRRATHDRDADASSGDPHLEPIRRFADVVCAAVRAGHASEGTPTFADGLACASVLDDLRG